MRIGSSIRKCGASMHGPRCRVSASGCSGRLCWSLPPTKQKLEYLPPICRGEIRWCQGYSEPGYGSDLAGLQTKAEDKGDYYLVNGSKIWTSYADQADWIFCLVRTDRQRAQARRHQLPAVRHGRRGRDHLPHPAHQRRIPVLPDVLRQRQGTQGTTGRRAQQGLDHRQATAPARAADDFGYRRHLAPWVAPVETSKTWQRSTQENPTGRLRSPSCAPMWSITA